MEALLVNDVHEAIGHEALRTPGVTKEQTEDQADPPCVQPLLPQPALHPFHADLYWNGTTVLVL